jgi:hypothetical protein
MADLLPVDFWTKRILCVTRVTHLRLRLQLATSHYNYFS